MHSYVINKNNFIYKNYVIRLNRQKQIYLVSYQNLIENLQQYIFQPFYTTGAICFGNWIDGHWYCGGLLGQENEQTIHNKDLDIIKYCHLIDEINSYNHEPMNEFWFFVALCHFTAPTLDPLNSQYNNWSCFDTDELKLMFHLNKIEDGMKIFETEGIRLNYIVKDGDNFVITPQFTKLFMKSLLAIEASVTSYDNDYFHQLDQHHYRFKLQGQEFDCFQGQISFTNMDGHFHTHLTGLGKIWETPLKKRESVLYDCLFQNKQYTKSLTSYPSTSLTGQVTAFYIFCILHSTNKNKYLEKDLETFCKKHGLIASSLSRELLSKNYRDFFLSWHQEESYYSFTPELLNTLNI